MSVFFFLIILPPPISTLFPYTTLFRSYLALIGVAIVAIALLRFIRIPVPSAAERSAAGRPLAEIDRKSTRLNSSHQIISYAVFCLKKKNQLRHRTPHRVPREASAHVRR